MNGILSFLQSTEPVTVVANDTLPDRPIITPMVDDDGVPKEDNNGNELGSIRLEQHSRTLNGSFLNGRKRTAFIGGTIELLERIIEQSKLKEGSPVPGKIKVTESLEPMWRNQTPKINPQTKEEVGISVGGTFYPVYSQMTYTDDKNAPDKLIRTADDVVAWLTARQMASMTQQNAVNTNKVPATPEEIDAIVGA